MKVLLVGSGGREHALAWRLAQSEKCAALYCAPGNAGIESIAECVDIKADDIAGLVKFAKEKSIDFVVVGPEGPLVLGLVDALKKAGIPAFGPTKAAAVLEGSKGFTKDLCSKYNIPTAAFGRFTDVKKASEFIRKTGAPIVVKADGLAAGKGVIIAQTVEEAEAAVEDMLSGNAFGDAGHEVVVEEFMDGEELSFFALADGKTVLFMGSAQDHKRVGDGDTGPNTGGMGAYSPAHLINDELHAKIMDRIITPTIKGMAEDGAPYTGVLYAGIMVVKGDPFLIEYNARFGDPECQVLMVRLQEDVMDLLYAAAQGTLASYGGELNWSTQHAICIVMAANGYPGTYVKNSIIRNIDEADTMDGTKVFHAGTAKDKDGNVIAIGGRVLNIVAAGGTIESARDKAYKAMAKIDWPEGFARKDIAWRAIAAHKKSA
jgi:phosphoribosylamine--glycine ligase